MGDRKAPRPVPTNQRRPDPPPAPPAKKPPYRLLGHLALPRTLRIRNTQTGEYVTVEMDEEGGAHRIALGGSSYELEWIE